jgi:proteasome lid subunit RPN8/RPN11
MFAVIKLHKKVYEGIINHAHLNCELECGGYLFGYSKRVENGIEVIVTDIYYEEIFGTDRSFNFNLSYGVRAKAYQYSEQQKGRTIRLLGCYHSHGNYPAVFSDEDRLLQRVWAGNQATIIYSPGCNEWAGDIIRRDGNVIPARITTFEGHKYEQDSFDNVAYNKVLESDHPLFYEDRDIPKTLKRRIKKR